MTTDDLSAPLGQETTKKRRLVLPFAVPQIIVGVLGLFVLVFVVWALIMHDPLGGEPMVAVSANPSTAAASVGNPNGTGANRYDGPGQSRPAASNTVPVNQADGSNAAAKQPAPGMQTITIIDGMSGKRQEVEIPTNQANKGAPIIDAKMLDNSRHGSIPRIAADGVRPVEAYARVMALPAGKNDTPRVAIVIGGLGTSTINTNEAIAKLPGPITFAFSPYATDIQRLAAHARAEGHEILLQVPMEPFDYPDSDPGPQTLLTSLLADQNLDRLYWLMSRFQGYVGIVNVMGGKFSASERALTPVLYEITKRGLLYVDDGGSPRSLAAQIAGANSIPFAKAEVVLDSVPTPANIDRALTRLEALARERGNVVGIATASPAVIERIAQWAKAAESRGLLLVPISVIVNKPKA